MEIGMLWFDNDPKTEIGLKVERAAVYYQNKYGNKPTLCYVHPSMLAPAAASTPSNDNIKAGGVEIRQNRSILPNHFWIGVNSVNAP